MFPTQPGRGAAPPRLLPQTSLRRTLAAAALALAVALGACDRSPTAAFSAPDATPSAVLATAADGYAQVSAGWFHSCAVTTGGAIVCWGRDFGAPPAGTGFVKVSVGESHACALRSDGSIACWGQDSGGSNAVPPGTYTDVSASQNYTCAVRTSGEVVCFGIDSSGNIMAPAGSGFVSVSTGMRHACALRTDGGAECWRDDVSGSVSGPLADGGPFSSVTVGFWLTCGLRDSGSASCWGIVGDPPVNAGLLQMDAGNEHVCGVYANGSLACWGNAGNGRLAAPAGYDFVQVSGGDAHSCAVKTDGGIACWGINNYGQSSPPPPPPSNHAPTAAATASAGASEGTPVAFDGSGSSDPEGGALTYAWDFGDGSTGSGVAPSHTYADNGSYTVTLTVNDPDGASDGTTIVAAVGNVAPSLAPITGATILVGESWTASGSFSDPGADGFSATVTYGTGSPSGLALTGTTFQLGHTYTVAGTYTVTVTVTDDDGGAGSASAVVVVQSPSQGAEALAETVTDMVASGVLAAQDAAMLTGALDNFAARLDAGNTTAAVNSLEQTFKNKVNALVNSGKITAAQGQALKAAANRLLASI